MLARRRGGDGAARGDRIGMLFAAVHESVGGPERRVATALRFGHKRSIADMERFSACDPNCRGEGVVPRPSPWEVRLRKPLRPIVLCVWPTPRLRLRAHTC